MWLERTGKHESHLACAEKSKKLGGNGARGELDVVVIHFFLLGKTPEEEKCIE